METWVHHTMAGDLVNRHDTKMKVKWQPSASAFATILGWRAYPLPFFKPGLLVHRLRVLCLVPPLRFLLPCKSFRHNKPPCRQGSRQVPERIGRLYGDVDCSSICQSWQKDRFKEKQRLLIDLDVEVTTYRTVPTLSPFDDIFGDALNNTISIIKKRHVSSSSCVPCLS